MAGSLSRSAFCGRLWRICKSTQDDIREVLQLQADRRFTNQLEVETYTWDVLPDDLKKDIIDSIEREMKWVQQFSKRKGARIRKGR